MAGRKDRKKNQEERKLKEDSKRSFNGKAWQVPEGVGGGGGDTGRGVATRKLHTGWKTQRVSKASWRCAVRTDRFMVVVRPVHVGRRWKK